MFLRSRRDVGSDGIRFLVAGGINTALTLALYQVCLFFMSPGASYTTAWLVGVGIAALAYPRFVYVGVKNNRAAPFKTALVYCVTFLVGLVLVQLGEILTLERAAIFVSILTTSALNFFVMRVWVRR